MGNYLRKFNYFSTTNTTAETLVIQPMQAETLATTDFPLYTVKMIGGTHFSITGGGGAARTGVVNSMEIYEIVNQSGKVVANKVKHVDTDPNAIMNCSIAKTGDRPVEYTVAAGEDGNCHFYTMRTKLIALRSGAHNSHENDNAQAHNDGTGNFRHRKSNITRSHEWDESQKTWVYDVQDGPRVQTDFGHDPTQKVVVFAPSGQFVATGGEDGCVRVWEYPSLQYRCEIQAESGDIEDLTISPSEDKLCVAGRNGKFAMWDARTGTKVTDLQIPLKEASKYRTRACKFSPEPDESGKCFLYTAHIPIARSRKAGVSYIAKWDVLTGKCIKLKGVGSEVVSALAVCDNGNFIATGTIEGSVSVFNTASFECVYKQTGCHGIFVTGMEFVHSTADARYATGDQDFTLLSVSADAKVKIHQESERPEIWKIWYIISFLFLVYLVLMLLNLMGF